MIVPFGAGGPADVYARVIAQHLSEAAEADLHRREPTGRRLDHRHRCGREVAPDGYTLLVMSKTHTTNESLVANKPFQLMRDFVPVAPLNYSDLIMVVHPSVAAKDLKEFVALARRNRASSITRRRASARRITWPGELFKVDERDRHSCMCRTRLPARRATQ
jgi:tripartite-type tricarboxylate transporter receptor subunit TctC